MKNLAFLLEFFPPLPKHWAFYLWNFYPPFFGAGIRIRYVAPDFSSVKMSLRLRWWNRNILGTLFGGSLYSMCDPIHMTMLMELLGTGYLVRDKGAEIRFLKKGTNAGHAHFVIGTRVVAEIWNNPAEVQERMFQVNVINDEGDIIAQVVKVLHVRRLMK